ncbi:FAD-dependent oxidoreductase [Millionella massiliensis]|uniref:FAD-dependent oxidoreductase n=1 Tax=Millionella massiliensis TaxID=1871023 RepID=UPI0024B76B00|nr:FAD-dependent oxidoreductase [Millionella massiliensis]
MKHLIIGGVAGGATAAARIRRADEMAQIILFEKGPHISYANCGLPYYIGGTIADRDRLFVQTPEAFGRRFAVDVRTQSEVVAIDPAAKNVTVRRADGTTYVESYDKLLLSPGAAPVRPPLPGIDLEGIFTLRNVADTDRIKSYLGEHAVRRAVVVGAGFIGLEMAENLHEAGAHVSIVEMGDQVMAPVDFSIAAQLHTHLTQKGVALYLSRRVEGFERRDGHLVVRLEGGEMLEADLVMLSIGVRPETMLARAAGLEIGEAGGIRVDRYLQTSAPDIYAVGDAIEYPHPLTGRPWLNYLAGPANRQGRIVADNMVFGNTTEYEGAIGTAIAKVFDMTVATTGLPAKRLRQMGIEYVSSTTHSSSHAGYYPGATMMTLKLTFDPRSGKLYGAQGVGYDGVDKRIDQLALAIKRGATVQELTRLEQAYAPPFASAKDPVAIAGYTASNILSGAMPVIGWRDVAEAERRGALLLDVRTEAEFGFGTIPGAVNIPLDELRERLAELPADRPIYVFCAIGLRGYLATRILLGRGFRQVWNLSGGYKTYAAATAPLSGPDSAASQTSARSSAAVQQQPEATATARPTLRVDACGIQCPGPVLKLRQAMEQLQPGQQLEIVATDAGFARDAQAWCNTTGNRLVEQHQERGTYTVVVEKGGVCTSAAIGSSGEGAGKTLILFSDDLDKALATFVLANGAAATGRKTTIFFTFWGLNLLKKRRKPKVRKDLFGRMFGMMLPSSSLGLHLSKMSMFGIGDRLMRHVMKIRGIDSLESLRQQALDNGVEFIACQMSMEVMGIQREELIDEVSVGGVATYMERAEQANVNLFI